MPIDTEFVKCIRIIYAQNGKEILTKKQEDCTFDGNTVRLKLTQEDTFLFAEDACAEVQIRVLTTSGDALASQVMRVHCQECLSDEVLS